MRSTPTLIFWWKHGVNVSVLRQTGLQSLSRGSDDTTQGDTWEFAPCVCIQGFNLLQLVLGTTQRKSTIITWIKTFGGWVWGNFICGNLRAFFFFYPSPEGIVWRAQESFGGLSPQVQTQMLSAKQGDHFHCLLQGIEPPTHQFLGWTLCHKANKTDWPVVLSKSCIRMMKLLAKETHN